MLVESLPLGLGHAFDHAVLDLEPGQEAHERVRAGELGMYGSPDGVVRVREKVSREKVRRFGGAGMGLLAFKRSGSGHRSLLLRRGWCMLGRRRGRDERLK